MTMRKPAGMRFESFVERQIREAQERGDFDALPGAGRPDPRIKQADDPLWWAKSLMAREGISVLPASLQLRRDVERELDTLAKSDDETAVRARLARINARIRHQNARTTSGPPSNLAAIDEEEFLSRWRARRADG